MCCLSIKKVSEREIHEGAITQYFRSATRVVRLATNGWVPQKGFIAQHAQGKHRFAQQVVKKHYSGTNTASTALERGYMPVGRTFELFENENKIKNKKIKIHSEP